MTISKTALADQLHAVRERIASACRRAGRSREDVTLVAVTKTVSVDAAALLAEMGVLDLGENRPQELWRKAALLPSSVRWHLIGHLQRNKVERTVPLVQLIHSVDSTRLLTALEEEAGKRQRLVDVLIEVNASREPSKLGFAPEEVAGLAPQLSKLKQVRVRGLMTMAALEHDPEACRPTFAVLRKLRHELRDSLGPEYPLSDPSLGMALSMGTTNDFEVAIEEGATHVRIGSALWEGVA